MMVTDLDIFGKQTARLKVLIWSGLYVFLKD